MERPLKILFVGDASSCHRTLAVGLRELGHETVVASHGGYWLNTGREIDLRRRFKGKLGGLDLWLRVNGSLRSKLRGFDIVSVASQSFIELRPGRKGQFFDFLKANNRSIFYTALGTDPNYVEECLDPASPLRYNEFRIYGEDSPYLRSRPTICDDWLTPEMRRLDRHIYSSVDGAMSVLYENYVALRRTLPEDRMAYIGIPIDTDALQPVELPERPARVRLFLGRYRNRLLEKGTDVMEAAARAVVDRYPGKSELVIVENRPYDEYLELLKSAHVVLDQLYSYTPATNALQAMAYGLNTVSGGAPEFYDFIGEHELHPVIHVEPNYESVVRALESVVLHPETLRPRGLQGREFVVRHNDYRLVASRALDFWSKTLSTRPLNP
ncbi:MAG: glycosyltransferase family 1 protein [Bacteroides sp.]|nr:glycosyltransferase family 1 protein [Bacteroides sp.]